MEAFLDSIGSVLAGYGVLGVWALYLIYQNNQKDKIIESRDVRINELIDRASDREIETTKILTELTILVRALGGK
jgi:hypothetical protein